METEITRDLLEACRMDKQAAIAKVIGVEEDKDDFWRERVALETNKAIVHSFVFLLYLIVSSTSMTPRLTTGVRLAAFIV